MSGELELIEPLGVVDTYVSGIARVELVEDGLYRMVWFVTQNTSCGGAEHIVAEKVLMSERTLTTVS